jgi:hypothetical protein
MLAFTEEGRKAVYDALSTAFNAGEYGEKYRASLHANLSHLNLRTDSIVLAWGESSATPNREEMKYIFTGEFSLAWYREGSDKPYMHGALYWHDNSQEFSTHT